MTTFAGHIERGSRMAYVYHVAGYDWAACSDPDMTAYLNSAESGASDLRKSLFGDLPSSLSYSLTYSADMVQTVCALSPQLGAQTVTASRDGGVDVGSWSVTLQGDAGAYRFGALFGYAAFSGWQSGLTGLSWTPDATTPGIKYGILADDLLIDRDPLSADFGRGRLYWKAFSGNGLKAWLEVLSVGGVYLWVGSSCLRVNDSAVHTDGSKYYVDVLGGQFNTPFEDLFYQDRFRYQITNVPLQAQGLTARLFAVPFSVDESAAAPGYGVGYNESYGVGYI